DRDFDTILVEPDHKFGANRAHIEALCAHHEGPVLVLRDLERRLSPAQDDPPNLLVVAQLNRRIAVQSEDGAIFKRDPPDLAAPRRNPPGQLVISNGPAEKRNCYRG